MEDFYTAVYAVNSEVLPVLIEDRRKWVLRRGTPRFKSFSTFLEAPEVHPEAGRLRSGGDLGQVPLGHLAATHSRRTLALFLAPGPFSRRSWS